MILNRELKITEPFKYFLENSKIHCITYKNNECYLFRIRLQDDCTSPYLKIRSNLFMDCESPLEKIKSFELREMIIKLYVIPTNTSERFDLLSVNEQNLKYEFDIQKEIYNKSTDIFCEPICPAPLNYDVISDNTRILQFLSILYKRRDPTKPFVRMDNLFIHNKTSYKLGIFVMECIENATELETLLKHNVSYTNNEFGLHMKCVYELKRLYHLGYLHGDPHLSNFLYDGSYTYMYEEIGRVYMIDFARCIRIRDKIPKYDMIEYLTWLHYEQINNELPYKMKQIINNTNCDEDFSTIYLNIKITYLILGIKQTHTLYLWLHQYMNRQNYIVQCKKELLKLHVSRTKCRDLFLRNLNRLSISNVVLNDHINKLKTKQINY